MKTFTKVFIVFLFLFGGKTNAQITLLNTFKPGNNVDDFQHVYLKHSGYKFVYVHSDTISLYNLNLSLFKNMIVPGNWGTGFYVMCLSEGLFDADTLHVDYMVQSAVNYGDSVVIYKDNGAVVFRSKGTFFLGGYEPGMQGPISSPIVSTDSGTFMTLMLKSNLGIQLYKLPGSLPCIPGCSGDNNVTSVSPINNKMNGEMSVYPNPAVSYTNISYTLPQGTTQGQLILYDLAGRVLKEYAITSAFDHLGLTTSDIAAGTYFYQLSVSGNAIAAKKIVVVK